MKTFIPSKRRADALVYIGLLYDINPSKSQFCPNSVSKLPFVGLPYDLSSLQCYIRQPGTAESKPETVIGC